MPILGLLEVNKSRNSFVELVLYLLRKYGWISYFRALDNSYTRIGIE